VPFWKDFGLRVYDRLITSPDGTVTGEVSYNMQLSAFLYVDAPAGREIRITTDHSYLGPLEWTYITRAGRQQWEAPWWLNGEEVRYEFGPDVCVRRLLYRQTGIDAELAGRFRCEDDRLNRLWTKAARTTYVCIRDNYMDCPDRERAQWWGDAVNEILQTFYALSPSACAHVRKGMLEVARWQRPDGVLYSPVPSGNYDKELPCQMLAGVWVMWQYYLYTADRRAVEIVYPHVRRYLRLWERRTDERGFVVPRGEWVWLDWGEGADGYRMTNALYALALDAVIAMARLLGKRSHLPGLRRRRNDLSARFPEGMWTGAGFGPDDRANALAVLAGLVRRSQAPAVRRLLLRTENASPYMERYVEEALFALGDAAGALERMRRRYAEMIDHPCSTLWEGWSLGGVSSRNHAWAGGPLYLLSAYVAGVRPTRPGFRRFLVAPMLGGLRQVECVVPTVRGEVRVCIRDAEETFALDVEVPEGSSARAGLPLKGGAFGEILLNGRSAPAAGGDERFAWVDLGPGRQEIRGRR